MTTRSTRSRSRGFFRSTIPTELVRAARVSENTIDFDLNLVVPDPSKSSMRGAIEPWTKPRYRALFQEAKKWARGRGIPTSVPWRQLSAEHRRLILEGDSENDYEGVKGFFTWLERKKI